MRTLRPQHLQVNPKPTTFSISVLGRILEVLNQYGTVCKNDLLGFDVIGVGGDLDVLEPFVPHERQQER
jgi:hypothetical protein